MNALRETPYRRQTTWNRIPDHIRQIVVELSLEHPGLTPRELSVLLLEESQIFVSESSFYRILHERGLLERIEHDFVLAADEFHHKTKFPNEMWQTDFTYFKVKGWGWYYLSTVIDDYSRYIIHWELCSSMTSEDVSRTIDKAVEKAGVTLQILLAYYRTMSHAILLPRSRSISVRYITSSIFMASPCIHRHKGK